VRGPRDDYELMAWLALLAFVVLFGAYGYALLHRH
jgi:hypothetical protein